MNKELIQKLFSKSCWDEQAEVDIEDFISVEKFAELIVLECAVIVGSMEEPHQDIAKLIKQHFGVAE
jgi:hypothetical protein